MPFINLNWDFLINNKKCTKIFLSNFMVVHVEVEPRFFVYGFEPQSFFAYWVLDRLSIHIKWIIQYKYRIWDNAIGFSWTVALRLAPPLSTWDVRPENSPSYRFQLTSKVANTLSLSNHLTNKVIYESQNKQSEK